jgi:patatin-like phospholipase/acyl hydrolase
MRCLAIDGGGVRGVIPATWLAHLEAVGGGPLHRRFDLVAGTSTGALLACAIGAGVPAREILDLYCHRSRDVFPRRRKRFFRRLSQLFSLGLSQPRYEASGLEEALKAAFGGLAFGDLLTKTMVVCYDVELGAPVVFKSWREDHAHHPVRRICQASAAAPTYFPGVVLGGAPLVDGGVAANNPGAACLAEAVRFARNEWGNGLNKIRLLSLGTGTSWEPINADESLEWGLLEWGRRAIDLFIDGSVEVSDYVCRHLLPDGNYLRLQVELEPNERALDAPENVDALHEIALAALHTPAGEALEEFA